MRMTFLCVLSLWVFNAFSQTFCGVIEYSDSSVFLQSVKKKKFTLGTSKYITNGEKLKSLVSKDWFGDDTLRIATSIVNQDGYFTIDSLSKTMTRMYEDKKSYMDELKRSDNKPTDLGKLIKTEQSEMVCGIECVKYVKKEESTFAGNTTYSETELYVTKKYGTNFNFASGSCFLNGYGIMMKMVFRSYSDARRKKLDIYNLSVVSRIKEMPVDEKEFELPKDWPVRDVNVTRYVKALGGSN